MKLNGFSCSDFQPHLVEYVLGQSGQMSQKIESHLSKCDRCREWTKTLQSIEAAIPKYSHDPETRLSFKMSQVIGQAERRANPAKWARKLAAISAAALVILTALFGDLLPDPSHLTNLVARLEWFHSIFVVALIVGGFFLISTPLLALLPSHVMER
jgi:predicted anti-sigma-YlaC factor YlaD